MWVRLWHRRFIDNTGGNKGNVYALEFSPHLLYLGLNDLCADISYSPWQMNKDDGSYSQHPQCFVVRFVVGPWGSQALSGSLQ
jgi:hypothetical protein